MQVGLLPRHSRCCDPCRRSACVCVCVCACVFMCVSMYVCPNYALVAGSLHLVLNNHIASCFILSLFKWFNRCFCIFFVVALRKFDPAKHDTPMPTTGDVTPNTIRIQDEKCNQIFSVSFFNLNYSLTW